ncbi:MULTISPECIES: aminotransferase class I/II-fold pyridoxal phosphate-dependent enzyme [unclassified Bosea (in: a-proteobacteria)]|jgi:8-amino-7-oxononanoate synthase|uniref:aminotransferase class I/II-fold pyridoxal phosphate-dependent enzyme n=1 Tax=Bosea sp. (in: a-proteobacteria) TaxID=1871050 RepID=UPI001AC7CF76|nr:aminotransferase class I/II-fold pyridoxal phosphate-dependent enzyme [Bosea sp. (in: a-proteobacteria)]MBN9449573.1 aminotransferase class I/II-fold pyridoxal phosphate-dependent enzyme [Bosea sp. (in: a-proteobacteria)]MBN9471314.1 aminotransferase class I/II-fold pyridoxal phosphate-dependent enzyme [Bosea sp. (in: a-proteobacteria)]
MSHDNRPLSDGALAKLLVQMEEIPQAAPALAGRGVRNLPRVSMAFEDHPLYQQMAFQRSFADFAKLESPYYRLHEARAGATSVVEGRQVTNFASYDYLGLNGHPEIADAIAKAVAEYGSSVSASRITAGERRVHRDLESALARNYETDDCVAFVSGHAGAVSAIATLLGPRDLILHDALIHNCVVVGAQLAGSTRRIFPHNDLDALQAMLEADRHQFERVLIVSEGLFSMDGDGPDLARLIEIKTDFSAWLMIDDAHGLGVLGRSGRGIFEHQDIAPQGVDLWLGTLSKSLVSCGGYVAGCAAAVDLLKHQAPGFVYSVGMPATNAVAATVALDLMRREPERVLRLQRQSQRFRERARQAGLDTGESWGFGVVPIVIGETVPTVMLAERLLDQGVNAFPIVPPGVPEKAARLRFFINATHSDAQIDDAVDCLVREVRNLGDASLKQILRGGAE